MIALTLALAVACGGAATAASAEESPVTHYVALGDSLTVGYEPGVFPGINPFDLNYYGFADRVYEQSLYHGRTQYDNLGLAGLTSAGLKRFLTAVTEGRKTNVDEVQPLLSDPRGNLVFAHADLVKQELQQADLVTITIGGNDFGDFQNLVKGKTVTETRLQSYRENAREILDMIYALNPQVQVAIADQYNPVPPQDPAQYAQLQQVMNAFSETVDGLAAEFRAEGRSILPVHVAKPFVGHELAWTHIQGADIHPNQAGYQAMAEAFSAAIWGEYREEAGSIVVDGSVLNTPYAPLVERGTTYVPLREYAEKLGAAVTWNDATQTATVARDGSTMSYRVGAGVRLEYGGTKTYVPLRSLTEGLGLDVQYARKSNTVYVNR